MSTQWRYNKSSALGGNLVSRYARNNKKGILIVEVLLIIAIINIALVSLLGVAAFYLRASNSIKETTQATNLAQETMEAVRSFRDGTKWNSGLGNLAVDTAYHPEKTTDTPPKWNLVLDEETVGIFNRKVITEKVFRDTTNDNISSTGTEDTDSRKIIVTVSWKDKKVEITTYLTNWIQ